MAIQLSTIRDAAESLANDSNNQFASPTEFNFWINEAYYDLVTAIAEMNLGYFLKYDDIDIAASTSKYALPTGFIKFKKIEVAIDGTNFYRANFITASDDYPDYNSVYSTSYPMYFLCEDNKFQIKPDLVTPRTDAIRYWYICYPTQMSSDSDVPAVPIYGQTKLLISYAVAKFYQKAKKFSEANVHMDEYINGKKKFLTSAIPEQTDTTKTMRINRNDYF